MGTLLKGEASEWWDMKTDGVERENITWKYFEEEFNSEYIGELYHERMRAKFISLKQGNRKVKEYYSDFKRLSKYARSMVATEKDKCTHFLSGLNKKIHNLVTMNRGKTLSEMLKNAETAEQSLVMPFDDEGEEVKDTGKRTASQSKGPSKSSKSSKHSTPSHSRGGKSRNWSKKHPTSAISTGSNVKNNAPKFGI